MEVLKELIKQYPDALKDKRKLKGLIADFYADNSLKRNVYRDLIEEDIIDDLQKGKALNNVGLTRYVKKMATKHGTNKKVAEEAILEWCDALGIKYNHDEIETAKNNQKQQRELQRELKKNNKRDPKYKELDDIFNTFK